MRKLVTFKRYFLDFYENLEEKAQEKYELRAVYGPNTYRLLFFFDEGNIVVLLNVLQKKTRKTPRAEIALAKRLKTEYYESKQ